ncbi:MAG: HAD family hydrolase [Candidatus Sumerlaeaceae bacterium]
MSPDNVFEPSAPIGVVFDNDGVLVDTEAFSESAYRTALQEQDVEVDPADAARYCGLTDADILRDMEMRPGIKLDFERFSARKRDLYFEAAARGHGMRVFPGALELIRSLADAQVPIALASSAARDKIDFNLESSGLRPFFQHIVSGEDFQRGKPDPEIFLTAAHCIGVSPNRCIVFEDSINGLIAARAAGMVAVGISNTFASDQLAHHADYVLESLENVTPAKIRGWLQAGAAR